MKIRLVRQRKKLRQSDLSERTNISQMALSLIENYEALPTPKQMLDLEEALGVDRLQLYERNEIQLLKNPNTRFNLPDDYPHFHIHVRLPRKLKKLLSKANFKRAGYKDMNHWFMLKARNFALQLGYVNEYFNQKEKDTHLDRVVVSSSAETNPKQRKLSADVILPHKLNNINTK